MWISNRKICKFALCLTSALVAFGQEISQAADVEKRVFNFKNNYTSGALSLTRDGKDLTRVAIARGRVVLDVPRGNEVLFEPNAQIYENPALIKDVPANGINRIRLQYLSMNDNDHSNCDMVMQDIERFKMIRALDVSKSDTSDIGLDNLRDMPNLFSINAFSSGVTGSCFKTLSLLPALEVLNVGACPLNSRYVERLPEFKKLKRLWLSQCRCTDQDLNAVGKCNALWYLNIHANPKISDRSMRYLAKLSNLLILDLRGTSVTMAGLRELHSAKLLELNLPKQHYSEVEMKEIRQLFPKAKLSFVEGLRREDERLFAPLR